MRMESPIALVSKSPSLTSCFYLSGPSLVGVVRKDWASQTSIALSWQETELPHAAILDYEIKYYEKVTHQD